jgi:hypothetical protein
MTLEGVEALDDVAIDAVPDGLRVVLRHPDDVVRHPRLSVAQKRALLAAWASDRHAVEGAPDLRQLESGAIVRRDTIIDRLKRLDDPGAPSLAAPPEPRQAFRLLRPRWTPITRRFRRRPDDDPPPPKPVRMRLRAAA